MQRVRSIPVRSQDALVTESSSTLAVVSVISTQPGESRWTTWWRRATSALILAAGSLAIVYFGRLPIVMLCIFLVQGFMYREVVLISIRWDEEQKIPTFKFFYYYWFLVCSFYSYMRLLRHHLLPLTAWHPMVQQIVRNYVPIAFVSYLIGFVAFVFSLQKRKLYKYQFQLLAYCHMALLVVVVQSTFIAAVLFKGLFWFVLPSFMVANNDCFAFIVGFFFGRTPLTRLSPKKTWEGFIGGFVVTLILTFFVCRFVEQTEAYDINRLMLCPKETIDFEIPDCSIDELHDGVHLLHPFTEYSLGKAIASAPIVGPSLVNAGWLDWEVSAMQGHCLVMAIFASLVAPFGGFFASGFKRTFKIKDFGQVIPGQGGIMDRMDCHVVMGSFVWIYATYVLPMTLRRGAVVESVLADALHLSVGEQAELVRRLGREIALTGDTALEEAQKLICR